ncbi:hypothetical protein MY5147_008711 [Beauveria neobassiana]
MKYGTGVGNGSPVRDDYHQKITISAEFVRLTPPPRSPRSRWHILRRLASFELQERRGTVDLFLSVRSHPIGAIHLTLETTTEIGAATFMIVVTTAQLKIGAPILLTSMMKAFRIAVSVFARVRTLLQRVDVTVDVMIDAVETNPEVMVFYTLATNHLRGLEKSRKIGNRLFPRRANILKATETTVVEKLLTVLLEPLAPASA